MRVELPESKCPACSVLLRGVTALRDGARGPKEGDFSVCTFCGQLLRFDANLTLQGCDGSILQVLPFEKRFQLLLVQALIRQSHPAAVPIADPRRCLN